MFPKYNLRLGGGKLHCVDGHCDSQPGAFPADWSNFVGLGDSKGFKVVALIAVKLHDSSLLGALEHAAGHRENGSSGVPDY